MMESALYTRVEGLGYSSEINNMILEVNSFPKIFYSMGIRKVNQSYPPKKLLWPPIGGVSGVRRTANWHP